MRRRFANLSHSLPKFKITMKMHKQSQSKAGRPISCEQNSILARLSSVVASALNALRPRFQQSFQRTLHRSRIYVDPGFTGPPVTLDGKNGLPTRLRTINRQITKNFPDHSADLMSTFDLSECYSKLDQKEIVRVLSCMITLAFKNRKLLAVDPSQKSGRWLNSFNERLPFEHLFTSADLKADVEFLTTNAYVEWLGGAQKQTNGIPMGLGISPCLCDYYLLYWELEQCKSIATQIRDLIPDALFRLPTLLTMSRFQDDILTRKN